MVTVVIVFDNLDVEDDGFVNSGESGHANLSVDRGVGIPAVVLGTIGGGMPVGGGMVGKSHGGKRKSQDKGLDEKMRKL